jgi:hypothetical protein
MVIQGGFGFQSCTVISCRSQRPRGLRRRSAAARLLRSWVRIAPGAWMFVCCERCVSSGRGLCDELIIRPEESYRLWCVVVCDLETSRMRRPWPARGGNGTLKKYYHLLGLSYHFFFVDCCCINVHYISFYFLPMCCSGVATLSLHIVFAVSITSFRLFVV